MKVSLVLFLVGWFSVDYAEVFSTKWLIFVGSLLAAFVYETT